MNSTEILNSQFAQWIRDPKNRTNVIWLGVGLVLLGGLVPDILLINLLRPIFVFAGMAVMLFGAINRGKEE